VHSIRSDTWIKLFELMLLLNFSYSDMTRKPAAVHCVILGCSDRSTLALLTRRANSTITVLPLKMFFVAHWTHAICTRVPIKSATSGTKHRHLATVSFLSHFPFFYQPEIDTYNPVFRGLRKPFFYSWHLKVWSFL